ncbi:hypothetical protein ASZ78_002977 [Callipepla squamata]|uniref:HMG box domain-containing protein n=1 Tax=Callipepla squamata TaxID=9009 RepID=A0A226N9U5_CALSU|nr:hypothetical protein ASZ78_002977 [Callipepla squamata]
MPAPCPRDRSGRGLAKSASALKGHCKLKQTFHTPSLGDEEFEIPPITPPPESDPSLGMADILLPFQGLGDQLSAQGNEFTPQFPPQSLDLPSITISRNLMEQDGVIHSNGLHMGDNRPSVNELLWSEKETYSGALFRSWKPMMMTSAHADGHHQHAAEASKKPDAFSHLGVGKMNVPGLSDSLYLGIKLGKVYFTTEAQGKTWEFSRCKRKEAAACRRSPDKCALTDHYRLQQLKRGEDQSHTQVSQYRQDHSLIMRSIVHMTDATHSGIMTPSQLTTINQSQLSAQLGLNLGGTNLPHTSPSPPASKSATPSPSSSINEEDADESNRATGEKRAAPDSGKKPKTPKKKKKKDPNEPQKPVSAYALFFRDTQAAIKGQNPNATFGEVSKIVASMWDSLGEEQKQVYKRKTEAAKKEYLKALAAYRASLVSKVSLIMLSIKCKLDFGNVFP